MLDWQGLLKFSLQHTDSTKKSDFKPMSEEDKKFLQGALSQFCQSQIKRIDKILKQLDKPQQDNQQSRLNLLEELQQLLDSLDSGNVLYKMGGHIILLRIIFYSKFNAHKIVALQIFGSINQNDAAIQTQSINCGAMELIQLLKKETDMAVKVNLMGAVSAMIRGENLEAKRIFIRIGGLELLKKLTDSEPSERLMNKINNLWRDLKYYDDYLHQKYKDLSSFSNTAGLKLDPNNHDLKYDINQKMKAENLLPENEKYRGCIARFCEENPEINKIYAEWLQKNKE